MNCSGGEWEECEWVPVADYGYGRIEKRIRMRDGAEYKTALARAAGEEMGEFRVIVAEDQQERKDNGGEGTIIEGTDEFEEALEALSRWGNEEAGKEEWRSKSPELQILEGLARRVLRDRMVKGYVGDENILILGVERLLIYGRVATTIIDYKLITGVEHSGGEVVISAASSENGQDESRARLEQASPQVHKEVLILALGKTYLGDEGIGKSSVSPEQALLYSEVSLGVREILPLHNQWILSISSLSHGYLAVTQDFVIVKEDGAYLSLPLYAVRKVCVNEEMKKLHLSIEDMNGNTLKFSSIMPGALHLLLESVARSMDSFNVCKTRLLSLKIESKYALSKYVAEPSENPPPQTARDFFQGSSSLFNLSCVCEYPIYSYRSAEVEERLLEGMSPEGRQALWLSSFCGCALVEERSYADVVNGMEDSVLYLKYVDQVCKDIERVPVDNAAEEEIKEPLKRACLAFACTSAAEYLQSQSTIGLVLFRYLGETGSYYGLRSIFERILPEYTGDGIFGLERDASVLMVLLSEKFPGLHDTLTKKAVDLRVIATPWLASLYTSVLGPREVERVFDFLAYDGACFLFKLALGVIELIYRKIVRARTEGAVLAQVREFFFQDGSSLSSMDGAQFALLLQTALSNTWVTHEVVTAERNSWMLRNRNKHRATDE